MKLYNTDKLIFWIKRLFMCKKQITPNDCYKYFTELESSIQYLYMHIPGHTRSLSGSILRHKISLKSAILYPFIP